MISHPQTLKSCLLFKYFKCVIRMFLVFKSSHAEMILCIFIVLILAFQVPGLLSIPNCMTRLYSERPPLTLRRMAGPALKTPPTSVLHHLPRPSKVLPIINPLLASLTKRDKPSQAEMVCPTSHLHGLHLQKL